MEKKKEVYFFPLDENLIPFLFKPNKNPYHIYIEISIIETIYRFVLIY